MRIEVVMAAMWICAAVAGGAWAGEAEPSVESRKREVFVGAGVLVSSKPYRGIDPRVYPIPMFGYEGERLYLRGVGGGYQLFRMGGWSLGPVLQPRFDGYEADDSRYLAGMKDRDLTLDGGVGLTWRTKWGLIGLSWITDLLGKHHGQELEFSYTAILPYAGFDFIPSAGLRYKSDNLVDYYYGVRTSEARAGRPAYEATEAVDPFVRLAVRRKLGGKWSLLGAVQYEWFDSEITDSPIVDRSNDVSFVAGLLYSF
jgi:outer membrane protein